MKYSFDKKNILRALKKLSLVFFAAFIFSLLPYSFNDSAKTITGVSIAHAETATQAEDRASLAAQRAGKAAVDARAAATVAEKKYDDSFTVTGEGGVIGGDQSLKAVAENARRLAENAELAHKAASFAAANATKAADEGNEEAAIEAADTATLHATEAQNYSQQITGIIANPGTATTNDGNLHKGEGEDTTSNTCWIGITSGGFNWEYCFYLWLAYISYFIIWLASWILGMSGLILDQVIKYTLVDMSANLRGITGINIAWQAFRDIANMSFIFILLYIGISTIINGASGKTNGMLRNVIIVAVLINFSLFFTKVIIDVSNILALGFYNGIVNQGGGTGFTISTAFMKPLGLTSIFNIGSSATALADKGFQYVIIMGIGGTAFILTAAFTFLFAAGLFLIRFAVIIILLLLSPLAYAGQILPATQGQAKKWWESLMGQIIFAPAYMLMLWGVLKIVNNGLFGTTPTSGFADALAGTANAGQLGGAASVSNVGIIVNFVIIIILLNACVIVAKTFAGRSGAFVNKAIGKAEGYARRWTTDIGAAVGRNTVGGLAKGTGRAYDNIAAYGKDFASNKKGVSGSAIRGIGSVVGFSGGRALSRAARGTLQDIEDVKFGTGRSIGDIKKETEKRTKFLSERQKSMDINSALRSGNESDIRKAFADLSPKEIENLSTTDLIKNAYLMTPRQIEHFLEKSEKYNDNDRDKFKAARFKPVESAIQTIENYNRMPAGAAKNVAKDEYERARDAIKNLSSKEVEIAGDKFIGNQTFIDNASKSQVDSILKTDNTAFSPDQKASVKKLRWQAVNAGFDAITAQPIPALRTPKQAEAVAEMERRISKLDEKAIEDLDPKIKSSPEFVQRLSGSQYAALTKGMSAADKKDTNEKRLKPVKDNLGITPGSVPNIVEARKAFLDNDAEGMAQLPEEILTHEKILPTYTPALLTKLATNGKIKPNKVSEIRSAIERVALRTTAPGYTITPEEAKIVEAYHWLESAGKTIF